LKPKKINHTHLFAFNETGTSQIIQPECNCKKGCVQMSNISLQKKRDKTVQGTDDAWVQIILGGEHCALLVIFFLFGAVL
jgi:hypothetical protein